MSFDIGATVAGKYRIERILGQGGMGTVFQAQHLLLDRPVALKLLRPEAIEHPTASERLLREGRALARLRGTHIARVLDVEAPENGPCFLVLEYLEGEDLNTLLKRSGPLPVSQALSYLLQAAQALAEAHRQGIVHRDIKPSNLFLTALPDGTLGIKVIDFGISKDTVSNATLTQSSSMIGSPYYMAPEQMRAGANVDARADIWSLGVLLYELLTGQLPHQGNSMLEICASILESEPRSPKALRPDLPEAVDAAVQKCLARDLEDRFATVNDFAAAIAPFSGTSTERLAWIVPSELEAERQRVREAIRKSPIPSDPGLTQSAERPSQSVWRPRKLILAASLVLFGVVGFVAGPRRPSTAVASAAPSIPAVAAGLIAAAPSAVVATPTVTPVMAVPAGFQGMPRPPTVAKAPGPRGQAKAAAGSRPAASAASTEADPVLQYGHY